MDGKISLEILGSAERAAILSRGLFGNLQRNGDLDNARTAWVIYLEASGSAEIMGEEMGRAVTCDII